MYVCVELSICSVVWNGIDVLFKKQRVDVLRNVIYEIKLEESAAFVKIEETVEYKEKYLIGKK